MTERLSLSGALQFQHRKKKMTMSTEVLGGEKKKSSIPKPHDENQIKSFSDPNKIISMCREKKSHRLKRFEVVFEKRQTSLLTLAHEKL